MLSNEEISVELTEQSASHNKCLFRATLHHINGSTSQINMEVPRYTNWSEFLEDGKNAMREYVYQLTRHWLSITHFFVESGALMPDGSISSIFPPTRYDIPLDKIYAPGKRGNFVSPEMHPHHPRNNQRGSSMDLATLAKTVSERKEAVYKKIDENTTLCGIPALSRGFYFIDGDLPNGEFQENGVKYLVIYSFIKTDAKGGSKCA